MHSGQPIFRQSLADLDALPEGDVAFDISGVGLGLRVVPRRVAVCLIADNNVVIAGRTFPGAYGVCLRWLEVLVIDAVSREVMITFDDDGVIALRKDGVIPGCFHKISRRNTKLSDKTLADV